MKNNYKQSIWHGLKALVFLVFTTLSLSSTYAQTITINDNTVGPYYTYGNFEVDYTAADYPAATTFYLIVDTNGNGYLDAEDDAEDDVLASSTTLSDIISGSLPGTANSYDVYVVAGEAGTYGEVISEQTIDGTLVTASGSDESDLPYSFDLATTARQISTPSLDLTSDNYYTIVVNVDATNVTGTNALVFEYSTDAGATFAPLTDQQGDAEFSAMNGELIFALSQSINVASVQFRMSQNNGVTLAAVTEDWILNSIDFIEYGGTFVQYNEQYVANLSVNSPSFTTNSETYDSYIGEDIEVDYEALGYTSGATFYLYTGDIYDAEDRTIFDSNESISGILSSTWPLELGDDNVDIYLAGIYGNIDEPILDFTNDDLNILGSTTDDFNFYFRDEGVRSASTDALNISTEEYVTLEINVYTGSNLTTDNALLVQYSTDGSTWVDMEDEDGLDEISGSVNTTFYYNVASAAITSSTRFRVRQKSIDLTYGDQWWYLYDMNLIYYVEGNVQYLASPFVNNYSITVNSIEDAEDVNITGGTAYPGDEITVTASVDGFDVADYNEKYTVLINNSYLLDNLVVSIDGVTDDIIITGTIPTNVEYANASDIQVKIYDGSEPLVTLNQNVFDDYNIEEDIAIEGAEVEEGDTDVDFFMAGDRSLATPGFEISSVDDLSLQFTLSRENSVRSPLGTEVVLEYSTDAGSTYTEIETYSLNSAGESGETYELDDSVLPSGMASTSTIIRFRQASNNGLDLDAWNISGIILMGGTNISDPGYFNYNAATLDVLEPTIALTAIDNANLDLYPTTEFDITFEIEGEFPTGTTYDLILEREFEGSINMGTFTAAGTHTVTVPSVVNETYNLSLVSNHDDVESNTVNLVVNEVLITNIVISSTDAVADGDQMIVYAGNSIDITYEILGSVGSSAVINLEIYDNDTDEYMFIVEDEAVDGTISATLPVGIDYTGNDADFRLTITNIELSGYSMIDEDWLTNESDSEDFFPVEMREGYSSSNLFYAGPTTRSAISSPLDYSQGGTVNIGLRLYGTSYYVFDQEVRLDFSIDNGDTWEELETGTMTNSTVDIFSSIDMPEEAWVENVLIRFIYNEDGAAEYLENIIYLYGLEVEHFDTSPFAEEEFSLQPDLILEELSVSMSTFEDIDFNLGEEFVVEYNAEGPFEDDVEFAIVMEQGGEYVTLAESDEAGAVQVTVNIPSFPFEDTDAAYNLQVIPFIRNGANDVFRASEETEEIAEEGDIAMMEGRATNGTGSSGYSDFEFELAGDRSLETRSFDIADYASARLDFDFTWYDGDVTTLLTLPALQISSNGTEYVALEIADATYESEGLVYPSGSYSVSVPEEYLASTTSFRWVQKLNLGENKDVWRIYNIEVVKGETNELNDAIYTTFNNPQSINVTIPSLDTYIWEQSDLTDAVFNGEDFEYNWNFDADQLDESSFPNGTEYIFTIDVEDPETGENLVIGNTSVLGNNLSASIPSYVENGSYSVMLTAMLTVEEETYYIFEDEYVTSLDVFLKAVEASYLGDENAVIYAGSTIEFGVLIENDESTTNDFSSFTSNLIVNYDGDDWLLATQSGIDNITIDLPPFIQDNSVEFRIELSEDGAIGTVGEIIENDELEELENDEDNFISGYVDTGNDVYFENSSGRGLITTRDFEVGELDDAVLFEFDVYFSELPKDLTDDQYIIFEYSIDGGSTYAEIASFPETDAEETLDYETFGFTVTSDMMVNTTRFRWRQEEIKGNLYLEDIGFTFVQSLPFDYISTSIDIDNQALLITSIDADDACLGEDIVLNYEIRGRFGEDNIVDVRYRFESGSTNDIDGYEFNLVEGTGSVTVQLPSTVLDDDDDNENFDFRLEAYDNTFEDFDFSINGSYSETSVEVVAPLNVDSESFYKSSGDALVCESEDVIITVNSPRDYFLYEIMNEEDGTVLGSITFDPENPEYDVNIGVLTENITLQMMVTSFSSYGSECNDIISSTTLEIEILEGVELYVYDYDNGSDYELVESGDSKTICEGSSSNVRLQVYRPDGSLKSSGIEWFKGDLNTPVSTSYYISYSTLSEAGSYFARVTDGSCVYLTESYIIDNLAPPETPEITVTGDLGTCDGEGEVTLEATAGYTYYEWSTGETTQSITVDEDGDYSVEVSNVPFDVGCTSTSESLELETTYSQEFTLYSGAQGVSLFGNETINDCEQTLIYFYDEDYSDTQDANGGIYTIFKDGVEYSTTTNYYVYVDESGVYDVEWTNDALNGVCTTNSPTITVNIFESIVDAPEITLVSGDLLACEDDVEVVLSAPDGFTYYQWSGGNVNNSGAQTVTVTEGGTYSLEVSNIPFDQGCYSPASAPVVVRGIYSPDFVVSTESSTDEDNVIDEGTVLSSCTSETIYFFEDDYNTNSGIVVLFRDGVEYETIYVSSYEITESGNYSVEHRSENLDISCVKTIGSFTVTIEEAVIETPLLTATGDLAFCSGEGEALLTAPSGFAAYVWYFNGTAINSNTDGFDATTNTRTVTQGGIYSVAVSNSQLAGCYSPISNIITITERALPSIPNFSQSGSSCGDGSVEFTVYSSTSYNDYSFQLIDRLTGLPSGDVVNAQYSSDVILTSAPISEATAFYLLVTYTDGSGCENFDETDSQIGLLNNVTLELIGSTIEATVSGWFITHEINWYRNGELLINKEGAYEIQITDAADYSATVDFVNGCSVTSNSIDLSPEAPEVEEEAGIVATIFPNPTSDVLNIEVSGQNFGSYDVSILSITGQVMITDAFDKQVDDYTKPISIQHLQRGIYKLQLQKDGELISTTILKN
ncbi:MAG: T9SS type A sorting domain-containing protein [Reichenbachiella sp.]